MKDNIDKILEDKADKREQFIEKLEKHLEKTKETLKYSIERFDILIVTLATGGLVLSINYTKDLKSIVYIAVIKIAFVLFPISLISNLISQFTSYLSCKLEIGAVENLIASKRKNNEIDSNQKTLDAKKNRYNNATIWLNHISLISLLLAILFSVIFIFYNINPTIK